MKEYSPKRRTALVLTGSGTAGAYHAGALKALDESGVKIDLVVGSGVGALAAAFCAAAGGSKLYGSGGFWDGVSWGSVYRARPVVRLALVFLLAILGVFLVPATLALLLGLLSPLLLIAWLVWSYYGSAFPGGIGIELGALPTLYVAALAVPAFALALLVVAFLARLAARDRRRMAEAFESVLDASRGSQRLCRCLWEIARGAALSSSPPSETQLGERYVALLADNVGQPGFRELIVRVADLETGSALSFLLLQDRYRAAFAASRARGVEHSRLEGIQGALDLRAPGYDVLFFDAVMTGLSPPFAAPVRRVSFPRGGIHAGETHRLADASFVAGSGLAEALAAGAEQVIVVSATPQAPSPSPRRRGPRALANGILAALERQAVERDLAQAERLNRIVETVGHRTEDGGRAWEDPATGRVYRDFALYVVRPERRGLWPLELDGALDPASEVTETPADLIERGYRDAYRLFVEPVVGAPPETRTRLVPAEEEHQPVEL